MCILFRWSRYSLSFKNVGNGEKGIKSFHYTATKTSLTGAQY